MTALRGHQLQPHGESRAAATALAETALAGWLGEWEHLWNVPGLVGKIEVTFSNRLRRSLGRCAPQSGHIRLHPSLLEAEWELLREVVCHEAAHVAVHLLHRRRLPPHGRAWAELMTAAGYQPRARFNADHLPADLQQAMQPRALYVHRCPVCGVQKKALRRMSRWRCRACCEAGLGGVLEISTRPWSPREGR